MSLRSVVSSTEDGRGLLMPWRTRGLRLSVTQAEFKTLFHDYSRQIEKDIEERKSRIVYQGQFIDIYCLLLFFSI